MRRAATIALAACVLLALLAVPAPAQPGIDPAASRLQEATGALQRGEYQRAADLSGPVARRSGGVEKQDRAEAWRIFGLSLFFLDRRGER